MIGVQILRAIAALSVVLGHLPSSPVITPAFRYGAVGVDLFFVISGFIMVHASSRLFGRPDGPRIFLARRIARIVPIYWAMTLLHIAVMYGFGYGRLIELDRVICSFAFFPLAFGGLPINGVGWTLNFEMFFYVVFAGTLFAGRRTAVAIIAVAFTSLAVLGRTVDLPLPFRFWCNPIIMEFVLGAVLALAYEEGLRLPRAVCGSLVLTGGLLFVLSDLQGYYTGALDDPAFPRALAWGVPALLIVAGTVLPARTSAPSRAVLALGLIGDASYCIYLFAPIATGVIGEWFPGPPVTTIASGFFIAPPSRGTIVFLSCLDSLAASAAITLVSIMIYRSFEKPTTRLLRRLLAPAGGSPSTVAPTGIASDARSAVTTG
jgi:exopolysaccharide production protein ExoZ